MALLIVVPFALLAYLLAYLLTTFTINYYRLPRTFHGPFFACISEFWLFDRWLSAGLHDAQEALLNESTSKPGAVPNVARIGPKLLVTNDTELLRHMSSPKSEWRRSGWYDGFRMGGNTANVFAERDEGRHRVLRGKLGNGHRHRNPKLPQAPPGAVCATEENLGYDRPLAILHPRLLSSIAFGSPFGFLPANADKWSFLAENETFLPMMQLITDFAWVRALFQMRVVQWIFAPKETDEVGQGRIRRFAAEAIRKRFEGEQGKGEKRDMLGSFKDHGLSVEECRSESLIQVIAGTDSTSTMLRMTMLYIVTNPLVYRRLQAEVDDAVKQHNLPDDALVPDALARQLPFLQAVLWEGLRKTPPLFGLKAKLAPPAGETFNGVFFPPGCEVANCLHAVTHRRDIFGDDVHLFRPGRWLEADAETRKEFERTTELVFGSGRFGCLGRGIAWVELGKVFFELMRRFDWEVVDPVRPIKENKAFGTWVQRGMDMRVYERETGM